MPTLPKVSVSSLKAVKPGSLVSLRYGMDQKIFGFRVSTGGEPEDPQEPALASLSVGEGGSIVARLVPTIGDGTGPWANDSTRVTDYGGGYSIHVRASDWDGTLKLRTFATAEAGLLVISEGEDLGLIVSIPWAGGCDFLNLKTWVLGRTGGTSHYVAAKKWNLSLPWTGQDVDWPLEVRPATPEQVIEAIKKK